MKMLSRVAENLYWMARYLERAEDTARLVGVERLLLLDFPPHEKPMGWESILDISGSRAEFNQRYDVTNDANILNFLCVDRTYSGSMLSSLALVRENLRTSRDMMPQEVWEEINRLYLSVSDRARRGLFPSNREQFLKEIVLGCQTITGILEGSLSQLEASTFICMGRQIERADMTTRIIDVRSRSTLSREPKATPFENIEWMAVLRSLLGYQMYRQQVRLRVRVADVLEFVSKDKFFPRSINYCMKVLSEGLKSLPHNERPLACVSLIQAQIVETDFRQLSKKPQELSQVMDELQLGFNRLHETICAHYFAREDTTNLVNLKMEEPLDDMRDED